MTPVPVGRALAWHVPPHLAMLGAMAIAMGADATGHLAAALALGMLTLALTPWARGHPDVHGVLLDLGAMTLVLGGQAMAPGGAGHAHGGSAIPMILITCAAWLIARVRLSRGAVAAVTGVACGLQLAAMVVF